jgi:DNA polymerase-3 subunit alpha (Gram-positive type)
MSALWEQLLEKRDEALVSCLTLHRVIAAGRGERLDVRFHAARLVSRAEFEAVRDAMADGFPGARVHVSVAYPALAGELRRDISKFAEFLSARLTDAFPGATPYVAWDVAKYGIQGDKLRVSVRDRIGASYLAKQGVDEYLSKLLRDLFDVDLPVTIEVDGDEEARMREIGQRRIEEQERFAEVAKAVQKAEASKKSAGPSVLFGRAIAGQPVPIAELTDDAGVVTVAGEIIKFEMRDAKDGAMKFLSFALTDRTASVACKAFLSARPREGEESLKDQIEAIAAYCRCGAYIKVKGDYQFDNYQKDMVLRVRDIVRADAPRREDSASDKRVELHLHTQMSAMDACASATALIDRAAAWGHEAIAITDHGVVQAFPEAFSAAKKAGVKLIPGCEGYLTDDFAQIVKNADARGIDAARFVVFDVETTGLNAAQDQII